MALVSLCWTKVDAGLCTPNRHHKTQLPTLVSHCWTKENTIEPQDHRKQHRPRQPLLDSERCKSSDSCQPSSAIAGQRRTPSSPKCHKRPHRPSSASAGLEQMRVSKPQIPQKTATTRRRPLPDSGVCRSPSLGNRKSQQGHSRQPVLDKGVCWLSSLETDKHQLPSFVSHCWTRMHTGLAPRMPKKTKHLSSSASAGQGQVLVKKSLEVTGTVVSHCWTRVSETIRCQTSQN